LFLVPDVLLLLFPGGPTHRLNCHLEPTSGARLYTHHVRLAVTVTSLQDAESRFIRPYDWCAQLSLSPPQPPFAILAHLSELVFIWGDFGWLLGR
jgi:hypothetical protein